MEKNIYYIAATERLGSEESSSKDLGIDSFIHTGTLEEARKFIQQKKKASSNRSKLYQLVEIET